MGLIRRSLGERGKPKGNRKVSRRDDDGAKERTSAAPKPNKKKASSSPRRQQLSGLRNALRRFGARVWPERFPELAAARRAARAQEASAKASRGFIWVWAVAVGLAAAAFVGHLHIRFDIIHAGYALSQAQAEQRRLRLTQRELRLELATLKEPGRIEAQARESLGMGRPDHERIVRLDERRPRRRGRRRSR